MLALVLAPGLIAPQAATAVSTTGTGGLFTPLEQRILDTRNGTGGFSTPMAANVWRNVSVAGVGGIPAAVSSVQVSFVVPFPASDGYLYAAPSGTTPNTNIAYVNYLANDRTSNTATIAVGANGEIQVATSTSADLVVDVQGYYSSGAAAAGGYVPLSDPVTIASTTDGTGGFPHAQLVNGTSADLQILGNGGVPTSASTALLEIYELNAGASNGWINVYPTGATNPGTTLTWPASQNTSWQMPVAMNSTGQVTLQLVGGGPADFKVSVVGYFTPTSSGTVGGSFTPVYGRIFSATPQDTDAVPANGSVTIGVAGVAGLPPSPTIAAVVANIHIVASASGDGRISAFADDQTGGPTDVYYGAAEKISAVTTVALGPDGGITLHNIGTQPQSVSLDVEGWYSQPAPGQPLTTSLCVTPNAAGCDSPAETPSLNPTLSAQGIGLTTAPLRMDFEIWSDAANTTSTLVQSGSVSNVSAGSLGQWTIQAPLANFTSFKFRARAYNGSYGAWSSWYEFYTNSPVIHDVTSQVIYDSTSDPQGPIPANGSRSVQVAGKGPIPGTQVGAFTATFSATPNSVATGQITSTPTGFTTPPVTITSVALSTSTADKTLYVGIDGSITIQNASNAAVNLSVTVHSWTSFVEPLPTVFDDSQTYESDPGPDAPELDDGAYPSETNPVVQDSDPNQFDASTDAGLANAALTSNASSLSANYSTDCYQSADSSNTAILDEVCSSQVTPTSADISTLNADLATESAAESTGIQAESTFTNESLATSTPTGASFGSGLPKDHHACPRTEYYFSRDHSCAITTRDFALFQVDKDTGQILAEDGRIELRFEEEHWVSTRTLNERTTWAINIDKASGVAKNPSFPFNFTFTPWDGAYPIEPLPTHTLYYSTSSTDAGKLWYHVDYSFTHNFVYDSFNSPHIDVHSTNLEFKLVPQGHPKIVETVVGLPERTDDLTYTYGTGTVFPYARPVFELDASTKKDGEYTVLESAEFVARSEATLLHYPGNRGLGGIALKRTRKPADIAANRAAACPKSWVRPAGQSCDEYPFASTKQGAGFAPDGAWASVMLNNTHNITVGTYLKHFYGTYHVLDGDYFYVDVYNLPLVCGKNCV